MAKLGSPGAFRRMWQFGLPSPHVHYFSTKVVDLLAAQHGLKRCDVFSLDSVMLNGLYQRIRGAKAVSALKAGAIASCVAIAFPVLKMLPPDIEVWVLKEDSR